MSTLDRLRREAKSLLKSSQTGDQVAVARIRAHSPKRAAPHLADALHAVAREHGYPSWPRLKFDHEAMAMTRAQRAERLKMALYFGQNWVIERLLGDDHPGLARANLGLTAALYDRAGVEEVLAADPSAATRVIGVRSPILHLAFSRYIHMAPEKKADMLAIAETLVANGADVNDSYPYHPGSPHRLSALYGALGHANNLPLAEWLLDHGADPDDEESLYHATELGHHEGLKLLMRHGVRTAGTNALNRMLDFDDLEGARLLLEYGADPNELVPAHPSGEGIPTIPALHQAARRHRDGRFAVLLLVHGADPAMRWQGHTPYALARIFGNRSFAEALAVGGHATPLGPAEALLADCADGRPAAGRSLAGMRLSGEARLILTRIAPDPERIGHAKALVAAGADTNATDEMGLTALHAAGWHGNARAVEWLLTLRPDLSHRNDYGGDALGTVIHGAEFAPKEPWADHIGCVRMLLEAGVALDPAEASGTGDEEMAAFLEAWRAGVR